MGNSLFNSFSGGKLMYIIENLLDTVTFDDKVVVSFRGVLHEGDTYKDMVSVLIKYDEDNTMVLSESAIIVQTVCPFGYSGSPVELESDSDKLLVILSVLEYMGV